MIVDAAEPGDVPALLHLMVDFNRIEAIPFDAVAIEPALRLLLASADVGFVRVLRRDGAVVGYAIATYNFDLEWGGTDAFITEVYVVPELRGQRLADRLIEEVKRHAQATGARALHLAVRPENAAARAVYDRHGFHVVPRLWMTCPLPP